MGVSKTFLFYAQALIFFLTLWVGYLLLVFIISVAFKKRQLIYNVIRSHRKEFLFTAGFGCLGFTLGLLIGFTTSPIAQFIVPALLTFLGGFVTMLLTRQKGTDIVPYATIVSALIFIPVFVVFGLELGSFEREQAQYKKHKQEMHYLEEELQIRAKYK